MLGHGRDSWLTASAFGILPMMFRWDAWLLSESDHFLAFISHDGFVDIALKTDIDAWKMRKELLARE